MKEKCEKAFETRLQIVEQMRSVTHQIEKMESEIRMVDEKIEDYKGAKDFVETVITENKMLSLDIKNILKQQIKTMMGNIFRIRT